MPDGLEGCLEEEATLPPTLKNIGGSSPSRKGAPAVAAVRPGSRRAAGAVPCPCWHMCGKGRQGTRPDGRIESALRTFHLMEYRKILWQRGEGPTKKKGPPGEAPFQMATRRSRPAALVVVVEVDEAAVQNNLAFVGGQVAQAQFHGLHGPGSAHQPAGDAGGILSLISLLLLILSFFALRKLKWSPILVMVLCGIIYTIIKLGLLI